MTAAVVWRGADAERVRARSAARVRSVIGDCAQAGVSVANVGSAPNLESSPQVSRGPGYSVTVLDFGDGIVEARAVFLDVRRGKRSKREIDESSMVEPPPVRVDSAEKIAWRRRRTGRSLRYRCLALKADHMLTFTKRGKFDSLDDLRAAWLRFYRLLKKFPNLDFRYVAVPELHGDGETWHLHVAVRGRYDVVFLRRLWYRALGGRGDERGEDTPGSLHARYFNNRRKAALSVAGYMSKYMGKSFSATGGGRRAFWASIGLVPASIHRWVEPVGDCVLLRVRDVVAPMAPKNTLWRLFEWEYVGLHGFVMKTH